MRRLTLALLAVAALVVLPAAGAVAKASGDHGNRGGNGKHTGWSKQDEGRGQSGGATDSDRAPGARDRSIESGNSYPQGYAQSDPDGMTNGGADKPGGTGGIDQSDQDGNNGCGNDADFEDDNNGKCLGLKKHAEETSVAAAVASPTATWDETGVSARAALVRTRMNAPMLEVAAAFASPVDTPRTSVLSRVATAASHASGAVGTSVGGVLGRTGGPVAALAVTGALLAVFGFALTRITKGFSA